MTVLEQDKLSSNELRAFLEPGLLVNDALRPSCLPWMGCAALFLLGEAWRAKSVKEDSSVDGTDNLLEFDRLLMRDDDGLAESMEAPLLDDRFVLGADARGRSKGVLQLDLPELDGVRRMHSPRHGVDGLDGPGDTSRPESALDDSPVATPETLPREPR